MKKKEIIEKMMAECKITNKQAVKAFESVINTIKAALAHEEDVCIRGFATLKVVSTKQRPSNLNGIKTTIPPCKKIKIVPSKELKKQMNKK